MGDDDTAVDGTDSAPIVSYDSNSDSESGLRDTASANAEASSEIDSMPDGDTSSDSATQLDTGVDADVDTDILFDLPACEEYSDRGREVEQQIRQIAIRIDPCACVQFHRLSMNVDWTCSGGDFGFHGTLVFTGREKERIDFEAEFYRQLTLSDILCLPDTTQIDGGTRTEGEQLVQHIANECGMDAEIVGRNMAAKVNESGIVKVDEFLWKNDYWTLEAWECANDILSDISFPCLANTAIGAWVFTTIE